MKVNKSRIEVKWADMSIEKIQEISDEYAKERNKVRKARERNRFLYATSASYRRKRRKAQKEYMKRKKERLEWEGYQQRLAMSQQAREILNY